MAHAEAWMIHSLWMRLMEVPGEEQASVRGRGEHQRLRLGVIKNGMLNRGSKSEKAYPPPPSAQFVYQGYNKCTMKSRMK